MTHSALPDNWQELMAGYALGDLSPEEAEELQHLLYHHPNLTLEVNQFQEVLALLPYALPQQEPPAPLRDSILATVDRATLAPAFLQSELRQSSMRHTVQSDIEPSIQSDIEPSIQSDIEPSIQSDIEPSIQSDIEPNIQSDIRSRTQPPTRSVLTFARSKQRRSRWGIVGGLAAASVVVGLSVNYYRLQQQLRSVQNNFAQLQQESLQDKAFLALLRQPNAQVYPLSGTSTAAAASGLLVVAPQRQQIAIAVQALPTLPEHRIYRLWAMPRNSQQPQYCGQFTAVGATTVQFEAADLVCSTAIVEQMLITDEAVADPLEPKGELVLKSVKF